MSSFELELVAWLQSRQRDHEVVALGIGDDMAIVRHASTLVLTTCDLLLDGVHFDTNHHDMHVIGRKAIACSLSDCAAMAVRPLATTVSLAWPRERSEHSARQLFEGMESIAEAFDVAIVGGDTTRWSAPLAIDVAMLAEPYEGIEPVRRDGAQPGDRLYVTGPLGGSRRGKHIQFTPRVAEARSLASHLGTKLHAMMDISDGLSLDLWRMCRASHVGAALDERLLESVVSDDARELAKQDSVSPLDHALSDGEDFELLLAVSGQARVPGVPLYEVGRVTDGGLTLHRRDGGIEPLTPAGYVH